MNENAKTCIVMDFKKKTEQYFHEIRGLSPKDIENIVLSHLQNMIERDALNADILNIAIVGTRCRGIEKKDSDLDVVAELSSDCREDDLFNIFNGEKLYIEGIDVDINPITIQKTGSLDTYLPEAEKYLEKTYEQKFNTKKQTKY